MLIASKSGMIASANLISETDTAWTLLNDRNERVTINKTDERRRVFVEMADALKWTNADPELIAHFEQLAKESPKQVG